MRLTSVGGRAEPQLTPGLPPAVGQGQQEGIRRDGQRIDAGEVEDRPPIVRVRGQAEQGATELPDPLLVQMAPAQADAEHPVDLVEFPVEELQGRPARGRGAEARAEARRPTGLAQRREEEGPAVRVPFGLRLRGGQPALEGGFDPRDLGGDPDDEDQLSHLQTVAVDQRHLLAGVEAVVVDERAVGAAEVPDDDLVFAEEDGTMPAAGRRVLGTELTARIAADDERAHLDGHDRPQGAALDDHEVDIHRKTPEADIRSPSGRPRRGIDPRSRVDRWKDARNVPCDPLFQ